MFTVPSTPTLSVPCRILARGVDFLSDELTYTDQYLILLSMEYRLVSFRIPVQEPSADPKDRIGRERALHSLLSAPHAAAVPAKPPAAPSDRVFTSDDAT
jgi:hypothetical protein